MTTIKERECELELVKAFRRAAIAEANEAWSLFHGEYEPGQSRKEAERKYADARCDTDKARKELAACVPDWT